MKKLKFLAALCLAATLLPSCMKTQTYIGDYQKLTYNGSENYYEYYKGKQCYLLAGLIPLKNNQPTTPPETNCEIKTKMTFVDCIVSGVTYGIFYMQTKEINAVRHEDNK